MRRIPMIAVTLLMQASSDEECRVQMETNFFGPLNLTKLALPGMRERKSGTIVNVSSIAGIDALATCGLYAASKHALEGKLIIYAMRRSSQSSASRH